MRLHWQFWAVLDRFGGFSQKCGRDRLVGVTVLGGLWALECVVCGCGNVHILPNELSIHYD